MRVYMYKHVLLSLTSIYLFTLAAKSQDTSSIFNRISSFPDRVFSRIDNESSRLARQIEKSTENYLQKLEKRELALYKKMYRQDSVKAKAVFGNIKERYAGIRNNISSIHQGALIQNAPYSGKLDSLKTALNFLQDNPSLQQFGSVTNKFKANITQVAGLQQRLAASEFVRNQIRERQAFLKEQLQNNFLVKEFREFRKEVYYYQQQVNEYREALNDPKKLGTKLLHTAQKIPPFKDFFRKNSQLAAMFRLPDDTDPFSTQSLYGLQTRLDLQSLLQQRIGTDPLAQQALQQNIQQAQQYMQKLKDKLLSNLSKGGSGDEDLDFKPNNQKIKPFKKRLELGVNLQSQKPNGWFPVTSDLGLSLGYKLNDKSVIGFGASYKLGWGQSIRNIHISHQGIGLRSFIDWKLKGSFWLSGGYEQNYQNEIRRIDQLRNLSVWQQSGLVGISKIISVKTKALKKTKVQLLWDFLSYQQTPRSNPVVFRVGYNFK